MFNDDVYNRVQKALADVRALRPLADTLPEVAMPISVVSNEIIHQPVDPMEFKVGEWSPTPWDGVTCFGVSLSTREVVVICDVAHGVRCDPQEHGPWSESLVMMQGTLLEHTNGKSYRPGEGVYFQPAGCVHEPEFKGPGRCVITWTRP